MNLRREELTIAEVLRQAGYTTGHFGKWHLARPFSRNINPSLHGFDRWLSTGNNSRRIDPNAYWRDGERAGVIKGSDNQILMDEALGFIRDQVKQKRPFLALIWFHTAHWPIGATEEFLALYKDHPELSEGKQMRYADISSMDAEMGRLRRELRELRIAENTLLCFCTDNGMKTRDLREGKLSLYEGGIRVPGLIEWPGRVTGPRVVDVPCGTVDYYPTILEVAGVTVDAQPLPLDGISLVPLMEGRMEKRPQPLMFWHHKDWHAVVDNRYKLLVRASRDQTELYDVVEDPKEKEDLAAQQPQVVRQIKERLASWVSSVETSQQAKDYP
jgi:arylsulfatase A-like enzyme